MGHEDRFPPPRLSGHCGFQKRSLLPMIRAMWALGQALTHPNKVRAQAKPSAFAVPLNNAIAIVYSDLLCRHAGRPG
jgi:hypothetical protein